MNKVIAEQKLSVSDLIDPSSAKQLGKLLGVDAIASGTVTELSQSLRVNARLISTETGEIFAVASTEIFKDESVTKLMASTTRTPSSQASNLKKSEPSHQGLAPGMKFEFEDKVFEKEKLLRVSLISIEMLDKNRPRVNMTIENLKDQTTPYSLGNNHQKDRTYLLDQNGEPYGFKDATHLSHDQWKDIPPGIPLRFSLIFGELPPTAKMVSLVLYLRSPYQGELDVTFKNVELQ